MNSVRLFVRYYVISLLIVLLLLAIQAWNDLAISGLLQGSLVDSVQIWLQNYLFWLVNYLLLIPAVSLVLAIAVMLIVHVWKRVGRKSSVS